MKTRQGFVSNSSTSSFILVTTKKAHDKAIKELSPEAAEFIKQSVAFKTFGKTTIACLSWTEYDEGLSVHDWVHADKVHKNTPYINYGEEMGNDDKEEYDVYERYTGFMFQYSQLVERDKGAVLSNNP